MWCSLTPLPHLGIGRFAIYDEAQVGEADLGVNFFLDDSCLGKSRAQSLTELIVELNPDVQGTWYPNEVRIHQQSAMSHGLVPDSHPSSF